ncbi:class I SAM-dependent methyltransferase [Salinibacter ruber]|uniref:class I SAM-dependent methyltransferase n=1 Tax=Salinibacter ruber TaxID=146919 RepID=UPI002168E9A6|nr:class I SAM-dependent methyltransferase [Salinibacter ruber]MCS4199749.1 hypothetical protein [Salinibacter ruber]
MKIKYFFRRVKEKIKKDVPSYIGSVCGVEGMTSIEEAKLLYEISKNTSNGCIVEVGSYRGRSTVCIGCGARDGDQPEVFSIEPHDPFVGVLGGEFGPEDRKEYYYNMTKTEMYQYVKLVYLRSDVVTSGWKNPVGFLLLDGDHSYESVSNDWRCWKPHLSEECVVAFDDSNLDGPKKVIEEIKEKDGFSELDRAGNITALGRGEDV